MESLSDWVSKRADVWLGQRPGASGEATLESGYSELDRVLPGGGWPLRSLIELRMADWGVGELTLLAPLLRQISARQRRIVWLSPPYLPYSPALHAQGLNTEHMLCLRPEREADSLWSMEKLLGCQTVGAVLAWQGVNFAQARRLKLAAMDGGGLGVVFSRGCRGDDTQLPPMPFSLRLRLVPVEQGLEIHFLKMKSLCGTAGVRLNWPR